jgi:hypothetical protein
MGLILGIHYCSSRSSGGCSSPLLLLVSSGFPGTNLARYAVPMKLANPYQFTNPIMSFYLNVASESARRNPRLPISGTGAALYRTCIRLYKSMFIDILDWTR